MFVEDADYTAQLRSSAATHVDAATVQAPSAPDAPVSAPPLPAADTAVRAARKAASAARRARKTAAQPAVAASGGGCIAALIRWAVFLGFIYYVVNAVGLWPDIVRMATEAANGEAVDTRPVVNRFRAIVDLPPLEDPPPADAGPHN